MSTLILPLPDGPPAEAWPWTLVDEAGNTMQQGTDTPIDLPACDRLVLVPPTRSIAWLRTTLPATHAKRWRAALPGLLEEQLLDEPEALLLALPAQARAGQETWVAATPLAPLQQAVNALEAVQRRVDAIVPSDWPSDPDTPAQAHVFDREGHAQLIWSDAQGVSTLPLAGGFARARLAAHTGPVHWTAEPAAVAATEQWLGHSVPVRTRQQHLSQALKAPWDLRQNELAPRLRGAQALQHLAHRLRQPEWRAWRWGMAALIGVQVFGLNALALQQHRQEQGRQQAIQTMLAQAFPQIPGADVSRLPASLSALRTAAGVAAGDDLEPLLGAAARHWPTEVGPVQAVDYEAGRLTLVAPDWRDELTPAFGQALAADGIQLQQDSSRLVLQLAGGTR